MELRPNPDDPERAEPAAAGVAAPSPDAVTRILHGVIDPELKASIVELGMLGGVDVTEAGAVTVHVALTTAGCPLRAQIKNDVESKVYGLPGVQSVRVEYSEMDAAAKSALMDRARRIAQDHAAATEVAPTTRVLAVASGKGGVGKSSVTVNLAVALAQRGLRVGVLDADVWGFSVPRLLGVSERLRGEDGKIVPNPVEVEGAGELHAVSMGFLVDEEDTALMWRGLILAKAFEQFLTDVAWPELDYLLLDLPPGTGDIQMALARLLPQAEVLVVTTPAKNAQKVATRVADMSRRSHVKVLGVVENMTSYVDARGEEHTIFGHGGGAALAETIGTPLIGRIPIEPLIPDSGDDGKPVVVAHPESPAAIEFTRIADELARMLLPPVAMEGCTARILEAANAAFDHARS
ncbi:MAG: Mrp/NBP35 family ATP-binding protein [Acidimicrobiia bacterium]